MTFVALRALFWVIKLPPSGPTTSEGANSKKFSRPSTPGEPLSFQASRLIVMVCVQPPITETIWPSA